MDWRLGRILPWYQILSHSLLIQTWYPAHDFMAHLDVYKRQVMNAKRESVQFMIFSKKYQEIANAIGMQMDHGDVYKRQALR